MVFSDRQMVCLKACRQMILEVIDKNENKAQKRSVADKVIMMLLQNDLAKKEMLPNHKVSVHYDNRHGGGVDPLEVHTLLDRIAKDGYSTNELGARWSIQKSAGAEGRKQLTFFAKLD